MLTLKRFAIPVLALFAITSLSHCRINNELGDLMHMENISRWMDSSADPCNDFHQYACGGGKGEVVEHNMESAQKNFVLETLALVSTNYSMGYENQHYSEKMQIYFNTLKNSINGPLLPYLNELKPLKHREWPLLEELPSNGQFYNSQPWTHLQLIGLLGNLFSYGLNDVLISLDVDISESETVIQIDIPVPKAVDTMELVKLFQFLNIPSKMGDKYFREFLKMDDILNALYRQFPRERYNISSYKNLNDTERISLQSFLKSSLPNPIQVEEFSIKFPQNYYGYLNSQEFQPEQGRKMCNYFMLKFLLHLQKSMAQIPDLLEKFSLGFNYIYYKHLYLPQQEQLDNGMDSIKNSLQRKFIELVNENNLSLSPQQLKEVIQKLENLEINVGNLPNVINESMVEEYYSVLPNMDLYNFYSNDLALRRFKHMETFRCPKGMLCYPDTQESLYDTDDNNIYLPFTYQLTPMFDWNWHPVFAMSVLGHVIGHEMFYAIDTSELNREDFTPSFEGDSAKVPAIQAVIKCLKKQNPTEDVNEFLADIVGSQLAFDILNKMNDTQPEFTQIPWQQLYYLSLAQSFCVKSKQNDKMQSDLKIRLEEIVMNSPDFAAAFQCPESSKLNPKWKCRYI